MTTYHEMMASMAGRLVCRSCEKYTYCERITRSVIVHKCPYCGQTNIFPANLLRAEVEAAYWLKNILLEENEHHNFF